MREITFRAFVSKESRFNSVVGMIAGENIKTMLNPKFTEIYGEHCWNETGLILMQFTGLVDKNDKEIYEGDICQRKEAENSKVLSRCKIIYKEDRFALEWITKSWFNDSLRSHFDELEVIGNIYENPELLS